MHRAIVEDGFFMPLTLPLLECISCLNDNPPPGIHDGWIKAGYEHVGVIPRAHLGLAGGNVFHTCCVQVFPNCVLHPWLPAQAAQ